MVVVPWPAVMAQPGVEEETDHTSVSGAAPETVPVRVFTVEPHIGSRPAAAMVAVGWAMTVTLKLHRAMFPHASVAVQLTVVVPTGDAAAGCVVPCAARLLAQSVAAPVLHGSVEGPHCNGVSGGQAITGAVVSTKSMCWTQVEKFPHPSVAFQVRSTPALPV